MSVSLPGGGTRYRSFVRLLSLTWVSNTYLSAISYRLSPLLVRYTRVEQFPASYRIVVSDRRIRAACPGEMWATDCLLKDVGGGGVEGIWLLTVCRLCRTTVFTFLTHRILLRSVVRIALLVVQFIEHTVTHTQHHTTYIHMQAPLGLLSCTLRGTPCAEGHKRHMDIDDEGHSRSSTGTWQTLRASKRRFHHQA